MTDTQTNHLELVDPEDIQTLELLDTRAKLALAHVEIQKLLIQKKYRLADLDQVDAKTGIISRHNPASKQSG